MKQVVQSVKDGALRVVDVPRPTISPTEVLVATTRSVVSPGTERAARRLARSSLVEKARARPDLVRQTLRRVQADGVAATYRAVQNRLDQDMPLGYSAAGRVVEVGEAVASVVPGQRVATGSAAHGELQVVPAHLAVPIPDGVTDDEAAFATIAAVALHGLRLAEVGPGSKVVVIGLGLIGQLSLRLALAAGHDVAGIDLRAAAVAAATDSGALGLVDGETAVAAVHEWSRGRGADAVLLTAASSSSAAVHRAAAVARDRASIVVIGDIGLDLDRRPFYEKELVVRFARSYGPGRYERSYEDWGVDYPAGQVRWTEGRNLEAVLDLAASGRLTLSDLITHRFRIEDAARAYELVERADERCLGVQLTYDGTPEPAMARAIGARHPGRGTVGLIGAGSFVRSTLAPALAESGFFRIARVSSASGTTARQLAERLGSGVVATTADEILDDPDVDVVVVATPHDTHAGLVVRALRAGKHVFCEKPLALTFDELSAVATAWSASTGQLMVGFNRRWSPALLAVTSLLPAQGGPLVLTYRVSAGTLPPTHWYFDRRQGGRLLGEVCHFVDACNAVVQQPVASVAAMGAGASEVALEDNLVVSLRYADGSVATISYSSGGHPRTPKERFEVHGRGQSAVIDDFRSTLVNGRDSKTPPGKGHDAELRVFRDAVASGTRAEWLTRPALETTAVTLAAIESLRTGHVTAPAPLG